MGDAILTDIATNDIRRYRQCRLVAIASLALMLGSVPILGQWLGWRAIIVGAAFGLVMAELAQTLAWGMYTKTDIQTIGDVRVVPNGLRRDAVFVYHGISELPWGNGVQSAAVPFSVSGGNVEATWSNHRDVIGDMVALLLGTGLSAGPLVQSVRLGNQDYAIVYGRVPRPGAPKWFRGYLVFEVQLTMDSVWPKGARG